MVKDAKQVKTRNGTFERGEFGGEILEGGFRKS
jgi:hypothetical protein